MLTKEVKSSEEEQPEPMIPNSTEELDEETPWIDIHTKTETQKSADDTDLPESPEPSELPSIEQENQGPVDSLEQAQEAPAIEESFESDEPVEEPVEAPQYVHPLTIAPKKDSRPKTQETLEIKTLDAKQSTVKEKAPRVDAKPDSESLMSFVDNGPLELLPCQSDTEEQIDAFLERIHCDFLRQSKYSGNNAKQHLLKKPKKNAKELLIKSNQYRPIYKNLQKPIKISQPYYLLLHHYNNAKGASKVSALPIEARFIEFLLNQALLADIKNAFRFQATHKGGIEVTYMRMKVGKIFLRGSKALMTAYSTPHIFVFSDLTLKDCQRLSLVWLRYANQILVHHNRFVDKYLK
mgnify:CR=1 FL=1